MSDSPDRQQTELSPAQTEATERVPTATSTSDTAPGNDTTSASGTARAPDAALAPTPAGTHWDQVRRLQQEGATREQMLEKLKLAGLDDESARVLINSVSGALPAELPSAQLSPGLNVLSPSTFTLSDIGLTGHPTTVGLYWMGFGAAILLALGLGFIMTEVLGTQLPDGVGYYAVRLGGVISMTCVAWGIFRYLQGVTIRRKQ